jgi:hypothetical protein
VGADAGALAVAAGTGTDAADRDGLVAVLVAVRPRA